MEPSALGQSGSSPDYKLQDLLAILVRWRWVMVVTFFAVFVPAALVALLMPPLYQATSTVLVSRKTSAPEYSVKPGATPELSSVLRTLDRKEEINAKIEVIKSRATVEPIIDELRVDEAALDRIRDVRRYVRAVYKWAKRSIRWAYDETKYALRLSTRPTPAEVALLTREELVANVLDRVRVTSVPDSTVIEASFRSSDPMLAQQMINRISDRFIRRDAQLSEAQARTHFDEEAQRSAAELKDAETRLEKAKHVAAAYSVTDQRKLLLESLAGVSNRSKALAATRARLEARVGAVESQLAGEPERLVGTTETTRDPAFDNVRRELVELEMQKAMVSQQFREGSPTVQDLESRIREARALEQRVRTPLEGSVVTQRNEIRERLRQQLLTDVAEAAAVEAEEQSLVQQEQDFEAQLARLSGAELQLQQLGRDVETRREAYDLAIRNRQQAAISESLAGASLAEVRIIDHASLPLWPIRPRRLLYLLIALAGSLLAAVIAPFFAEFNNETFTSEADVREHVGPIVVAAFPSRARPLRRGAGVS
jgi:uncharacterized protein involved in exopolysaccharide biosynthesis